MAYQGEIFLSGDIAYLDPAAITSLIAPLVDHRLNTICSWRTRRYSDIKRVI